MSIYGGLLFNQGYVHDVATARLLDTPASAPAAGGDPQAGAPAGTRGDAARPVRARRRPGAVTLRAALLSAFR